MVTHLPNDLHDGLAEVVLGIRVEVFVHLVERRELAAGHFRALEMIQKNSEHAIGIGPEFSSAGAPVLKVCLTSSSA